MDNQPPNPIDPNLPQDAAASGNTQDPALGNVSVDPAQAAEAARQKLLRLFGPDSGIASSSTPQQATAGTTPGIEEPAAAAEAKAQTNETEEDGLMIVQRSKHQLYMDALKASGKSAADIQTAWHHYYSGLNDVEKHEVWREFYEADKKAAVSTKPADTDELAANFKKTADETKPKVSPAQTPDIADKSATQAAGEDDDKPKNSVPEGISQQAEEPLPPGMKAKLLRTIRKRLGIKPKQHLQSLLFGLACGTVAVVVVLFGFFNEVIIAPFIQPSRTVNNTPIIIGTDGLAPTDKAEVIIPKINVEIPLDFSAKTLKEEDIQKGLENGVAHYPSTPLPGQVGNTAFFGHSSNNIFNAGKYKFAFVLLHELVPGDTFYLTRNGVAYAYQVFDKKVVEPNNVAILNPIAGKAATATLITCDPPGTTLRRLVIVGEQVSPAPGGNTPGGIQTAAESGAKELPGNGPTLWQRFMNWLR